MIKLLSSLSLIAVLAGSLAPVAACGNERRAKECTARCEEEAHACERRKEPTCSERAKKCGEECER